MKIYQYEGKNIADLKLKVMEELNKPEEELIFKYGNKEDGGIFRGKREKIEVLTKEDIINYIKEQLKEITDQMGVKVNLECRNRENYIGINIFSNTNNAILIGKNGRTIDALQRVLKHSILNTTGFYVNLILDVEGYKENQHRYLERDAKTKAVEAQTSGETQRLENMNSYQRRLVHNFLSSMDVTTESEGEEPNRYVVIKPNKTP